MSLQLSTFEISLNIYRSFTNHRRLRSRDVHTVKYHYETFYDLHYSLGGQIVKHFIVIYKYIHFKKLLWRSKLVSGSLGGLLVSWSELGNGWTNLKMFRRNRNENMHAQQSDKWHFVVLTCLALTKRFKVKSRLHYLRLVMCDQ